MKNRFLPPDFRAGVLQQRKRKTLAAPWFESGFAMPMAFALGLCMMALATTTIILAQSGRDSAASRQESSASLLMSDSAIAEILTELSLPKNSVLLGKNYDPNSYLGPDTIPNTADDATDGGIDEWQGLLDGGDYNCQASYGLSLPNDLRVERSLGADASYQILAYRYDQDNQAGSLLVRGTYGGVDSIVHMSLAIAHDARDFPGVLVDSVLHWQGRQLAGKNGNAQFNPTDDDFPPRLQGSSLSSSVTMADVARPQYLDMIWSGSYDGFTTDPVEGKLTACNFSFYAAKDTKDSPHIPFIPTGEAIGDITGGTPGLVGDANQAVKEYQATSLILSGTDELLVDTTDSPVHLYVTGEIQLSGNSKIRNVRMDGRPSQVGDLRIIQSSVSGNQVLMEDSPCIENAFLYIPEVDFRLFTTADGCPGPSDSNVIGVVWAEDIENSAHTSSDFDPGEGPGKLPPIIPGTSGIEVPDDVSSMTDELEAIKFPVFYRISGVTSWNHVNL